MPYSKYQTKMVAAKNGLINKITLQVFLLIIFAFPVFPQPALPIPDGIGSFWNIMGSRVVKLNAKGEISANFSQLSLGVPHSIDASDPFRVLVFYFDSQHIAILGSNATLLGKLVRLIDLDLGEISLACRSLRGGVWMLHRQDQEIIHFDDQMKRTNSKIVIDKSINVVSPSFLIEKNGILYLGINGKKVIRFDLYGSRLPDIDIQFDDARFSDNRLLIKQQASYYSIYIDDEEITPLKLSCNCPTFPIPVGQDFMCFDGEKFVLCKKNE